MTSYLSLLEALTECVSISGTETKDKDKIISILSPYFDRVEVDRLGNTIATLSCGKTNAPVLLIDTHFDQIGLLVTDRKEGGFLSVTSIGGLDTRILPAMDVTIHGKKELFGVITSTPPHLRKAEDADKLSPVDELLIDCGVLDTERLKELVPIGSPVSFRVPFTKLQNGRVAGVGLDNKACCAAGILFASMVDKSALCCDVVLLLSSFEEIGGKGAVVGTYTISPDLAIVLDVNFAKAPGIDSKESIRMGEGPSVSLSVLTHRGLSKRVIALAKENEIPCQTIVEVGNLGTNGNNIPLQREGVPTVNMSLPLSSMHTASEIVAECDGEALAKLLCQVACDQEVWRMALSYSTREVKS
ncbi:MAG: hypothetical protein J6R42_03425 [Clostridia bacterium]|nr:hypothetical protein [Clostridia bacterium]